MTESESSAASVPPPADWQPLPLAARRVSTLVGALGWLPFGVIPALVATTVIDGWPARIALGLACMALAALVGARLGRARWSRTTWRLDDRGLQVRRGLVWRNELLVPRTRVQHLDIERGPIERRHGLATLIVHTAGTRLYALRQSGFLDAEAVALRDALLPEADRHDDAL
jgi:membrane protein YdbS with pleckstrin-like domain